mgnify:CR=1 FL=1
MRHVYIYDSYDMTTKTGSCNLQEPNQLIFVGKKHIRRTRSKDAPMT